jgi:phosphoserine phosphatase
VGSRRFDLILWDFDGTLIPFDSEQFTLESLFRNGKGPVSARSLAARLFVHGDRRGWHPGLLKVLYGWCLRGVFLSRLDGVCDQIAAHISTPDREALRRLRDRQGLRMVLLSCGTADLGERTLRAAGLEDCFDRVEANRLIAPRGCITGIERRIVDPRNKVDVALGYGVPWDRVVAVGDGLTDLPLLDCAGLPILIARVRRFDGRGYRVVSSLSEALASIAAELDP